MEPLEIAVYVVLTAAVLSVLAGASILLRDHFGRRWAPRPTYVKHLEN